MGCTCFYISKESLLAIPPSCPGRRVPASVSLSSKDNFFRLLWGRVPKGWQGYLQLLDIFPDAQSTHRGNNSTLTTVADESSIDALPDDQGSLEEMLLDDDLVEVDSVESRNLVSSVTVASALTTIAVTSTVAAMLDDRNPQDEKALEDNRFPISVLAKPQNPGTLFIEARLKDGFLESAGVMDFEGCEEYAETLERQLTSAENTFDMFEDILADERMGPLKLGSEYTRAGSILQSLRIVEHIGPTTLATCFSSLDVKLKIQVFELYTTPSSLDNTDGTDEQLGEVVSMPHIRFEGVWDELVFDREIKADLIWMMTNILRFSQAFATNNLRRKLNPLILLYGPPGTGKTSLCQGLAQKISIRLGSRYKSTQLIQIKTAILLSKYFSESAKHVDEIFTSISQMCEEDPERFVCVLIDEVESIASSREFSTKEGESHDSLRATNALLTGLDRTANFPNVVFLFTSNMCDVLEPAFLDRCGLKEFVGLPSLAAQYEILRSILQNLITCNVIQSEVEIPDYDTATFQADTWPEYVGPRLLEVVKLIRSANESLHTEISGRSIAQLPEKALMKYLRDEECDIDTSLKFMQKCILDNIQLKKPAAKIPENETRATKRSWGEFLEEECDLKVLDFMGTYRAGLEARRKEASRDIL